VHIRPKIAKYVQELPHEYCSLHFVFHISESDVIWWTGQYQIIRSRLESWETSQKKQELIRFFRKDRRGQFHQRFMRNFYARRFPKAQKWLSNLQFQRTLLVEIRTLVAWIKLTLLLKMLWYTHLYEEDTMFTSK